MKRFKNIVFDLGGVLFARDPRRFEREFIEFFSYITLPKMPHFWEEYDRGAVSYTEVVRALADYNHCDEDLAEHNLRRSIVTQETLPATASLIAELRKAGYRLYVLSNMSREFIEFLRKIPVYRHFEGEVVSCEEGVCKPEPEIYRLLLSRYGLNPAETLFIDDRRENIEGAEREGISGFWFDRHDLEATCNELRALLLK